MIEDTFTGSLGSCPQSGSTISSHPVEPVLLFSSGSLCVDAPKNTVGIYGLRNHLNSKWYVGQSDIGKRNKGVRSRAQQYLLLKCRKQKALYNALKFYGLMNFSDYLLEECRSDQLNQRESYWIERMNSLSPNGYNLTTGGGHYKMSDETISRISRINRGRVFGPEVRKKMSLAHLGKPGHKSTDETNKRISDAKKGKRPHVWSVESRRKLSATLLAKRKDSPEKADVFKS
jgi:group I intron endonuclease